MVASVPARVLSLARSLTGTDFSSPRRWWQPRAEGDGSDAAGPRANRRLTALAGVIVLPLASLVLLTGLFFGNLWHIHYFLAYLLLPVVLLKIGSTSYRMARYYLHSGPYRLIRPPYPLGRLTSPLLVISVVVLFVSGIVMWLTHTQRDPWGWLHTDAAIAFSVIAVLHLAMYVPDALHAARDELRPLAASTRSGGGRRALLSAAVIAGLLLAVLTIAPSRQPARAHHHRDVSARER